MLYSLSLDGTDDHISVPDFGLGPNFTISLWIKPATVSGAKDLFDKNNQSNQGIQLYRNGTTLTAWAQGTGFTGGGVLAASTWQHVALTYQANSATGAKFYVGG